MRKPFGPLRRAEDIDSNVDGENYLARTVYEHGKIGPIGFINWDEFRKAEKAKGPRGRRKEETAQALGPEPQSRKPTKREPGDFKR